MRRGRRVSILAVLPTLLLCSLVTSTVLAGGVQAGVEAADDHANVTPKGQVLAELEPGHPVDKTLGPNETHNYEAKLSADQYLSLAVEPQDLDVFVTIFAPDGHQVLKKISSYGAQGP